MTTTDVVVIGGGQAGLAMSGCLSRRGIDHVVLERGRVGERWRSERWDSLRLLTPNWQSRLPGFRYDGPDPDGYMGMSELVSYLERYAASFDAPVETDTLVVRVDRAGSGFRAITSRGEWHSRAVVIATGECDLPYVPDEAATLSPDIAQVTPTAYRNPGQLPDGGVLVVGASASGVQLADEIAASGRPVAIAVGRHTRLPRVYRGKDIMWWLDTMGLLDVGRHQVFDPAVSRGQPSLQLVGRSDRATLDLGVLAARGVQVVGRLRGIDRRRAWFDDDLMASTAASDAKLASLLARIDDHIAATGQDATVPESPAFEPTWTAFTTSATTLDLDTTGINTVLWATGFRRAYPWLAIPVLDQHGEVRHVAGVTPCPGLYVLGLQFLTRRKSAFLDGVGQDAEMLARHICLQLEGCEAA